MLAVFLLVFAAITVVATLFVVSSSRVPGGMRVWITVYNAGLITALVMAALALMS